MRSRSSNSDRAKQSNARQRKAKLSFFFSYLSFFVHFSFFMFFHFSSFFICLHYSWDSACTSTRAEAQETNTKTRAQGHRSTVPGGREDRLKASRANLQPKATLSSSTSESPASNTGAMRAMPKVGNDTGAPLMLLSPTPALPNWGVALRCRRPHRMSAVLTQSRPFLQTKLESADVPRPLLPEHQHQHPRIITMS